MKQTYIDKGFLCPFCNSTFPLIDSTYRFRNLYFDIISDVANYTKTNPSDEIKFQMFKCPSCKNVTVRTLGIGDKYPNIATNIYPKSSAKQFPDFIPQQIRQDYEEAYAIVELSPKASATLSRRTLQSMIRDFYKIKGKSLFDEINDIEDKIDPTEKPVLDSLRQIGNIGAHPEENINTIVDIEPGEAEKLLKVIEYFMKSWYINRNEVQQLFEEVNSTNEKLQNQRKNQK